MSKKKSFVKLIEIDPPKGYVTKVFKVLSINGDELGLIKFFPRWRKYVFMPNENTLFDMGCLGDIIDYINVIQQEWKHGKSRSKID